MVTKQSLIFIYGPMCSGKSTLAYGLANNLGFEVVDSDEIMAVIHPNSDYSDTDREDMYRETFNKAVLLFNSGKSVIVSCAFTNDKYLSLLKDTGLYNMITYSILLQVSPENAVSRWQARKNNPKIQTEEVVFKYAVKEFPIILHALVQDTNMSPAEVLANSLKELNC